MSCERERIMTMNNAFSGRVIHLPEEDFKFSMVSEVKSGEVIREKKVRVDDLIEGMLSMVEFGHLLQLILKDQLLVKEVIDVVLEQNLEQAVPQLLKNSSRILKNGNDKEMIKLLKALVSSIKVDEINRDLFQSLLGVTLSNIRDMKDASETRSLFLPLLDNLKVFDSEDKELQHKIIDMVMKLPDEKPKKVMMELLSNYQPEITISSTPILPKGTILYQETNHSGYHIVMEVERALRDVIFMDTPFTNVGHPKLLFFFSVKDKKITASKLVAVKDVNIKAKTKLYRFPFTNVYSGSQKCCWPELNKLQISDVSQLNNLPHLFFNSPANNHLFGGKNLREVFTLLKGKEFDDSTLEPLNITFESFFNLHIQATKTKKIKANA